METQLCSSYIVNNVDTKYTIYSDLPAHRAPGGGSIPPELCLTALKLDIVILDKHKKTIHLFEFTCPERSILKPDIRRRTINIPILRLILLSSPVLWIVLKCHQRGF